MLWLYAIIDLFNSLTLKFGQKSSSYFACKQLLTPPWPGTKWLTFDVWKIHWYFFKERIFFLTCTILFKQKMADTPLTTFSNGYG